MPKEQSCAVSLIGVVPHSFLQDCCFTVAKLVILNATDKNGIRYIQIESRIGVRIQNGELSAITVTLQQHGEVPAELARSENFCRRIFFRKLKECIPGNQNAV